MSSVEKKHFLAGTRIVVAGAGIGGLTFCIALQQFLETANEEIESRPSIVVYERDTSAHAMGREGYSLSIRGDPFSGGMQVLQKLGMLDDILASSNPGGYFTLFDTDFTRLMEVQSPAVEGLAQSNIRIARSKLREIMIEHVPVSVLIHWNCAITAVQQSDNGEISIDLSDGTQRQCDLLIVADGAKSVIRRSLRPEHQLRFAGAVTIAARTRALEQLPPPLDKTWGGVIGGNGHFLFVAPSDQTSALWSVSYLSNTPREPKAAGKMTDAEIDQVLAEVKERSQPYSEPMPTLLRETLRSSISIFNAQDLAPFRNHGSVIFIGDAQHAMSPFAGNGANMAMMDGYQLAEQLVQASALEVAVKNYDDQSIPRSTNAIKVSHHSIKIGHAQGIWKYIWVKILKVVAWYWGFSSRR